ncbi:hypothetical protein [Polaribacter gochangensis]|uniref:hypothetical protein n=1 Tax=Polaribacter gochangensis TaxID=3252903 RepID=UPI00390464AF
MIKKIIFIIFVCIGFSIYAQTGSSDFRSKDFTLVKDTVQIDSVSINSQLFKVFSQNKTVIPTSEYQVDFIKAQLIINSKKHPFIRVEYFRFPDFITKTYQKYNDNIIVPNTNNTQQLYSLTTNKNQQRKELFNNLETSGNITRGLTIGNNQNSVVNSSLDLTIKGNLSKDVTIKANIFDTNIPLQDNGYSQNITDFDRIFIEFEHKNWRVKAGDLDLTNSDSYFMPFSKKVAGLEVEAKLNDNLNVLASGAVVRGKFTSFKFLGKEGNQGPYKIIGPNNEAFIIIVAGSDALYANGVLLNRGENKDYTIDYNNSEIRFNTTFPVTNDIRFHLDYQYSNRNYTRFVTYEKAKYVGEKFTINGIFYNENDAKNQPIQQNLSDSQKQILANAGNDESKMFANSAYEDVYSENRILYRKVTNGVTENFEYSTNATDQLYNVTFTFVGANKGDYTLDKTIAIGNIYKYVGINLGNYQPIIRLAAPSKSQVAVVNTTLNLTKKTSFFGEIALSNTDANLFSTIDDSENKGLAAKLKWQQLFVDKKWRFSTDIGFEYVQQNFATEQRFDAVEFLRDWNIVNPLGNRNQISTQLILDNTQNSKYIYGFNLINYSDNYNGIKHVFNSQTNIKNTKFSSFVSLLNSSSTLEKNKFLRAKGKIEHSFSNSWLGGFINVETNKIESKSTQQKSALSHQFKEYETFIGLGDSTKVFTKIGFNFRQNDSIRNNAFTEVNSRKTYYINSRILQNTSSNLSILANYRSTKNTFTADEKALNSKIVYSQKLFRNFINFNTVYETSSGNIPQQEYVYIKTEPGQGYYTWIDYNNNGIKEFNEFEIAIYKDQAAYLRVALPNITFINTQRAKWQQVFTINPSQWATKSGVKKVLSHFYNQTNFVVDNEQKRTDNSFNLNPFDLDESKLLGLNFSFRNSLYLNKNLQKYSLIFTYATSKNKHLYNIGNQENNTKLHQLEFAHKLAAFWLFDLKTNTSKDEIITENFTNQNYRIDAYEIAPKFTFEYNKNHQFSFFYNYKNKENNVGSLETLQQQKLGSSYYYKSTKDALIRVEINLFHNNFMGNQNSPVAYQMLEGLLAGRNYTWSLMYQQKINSFINLNFNYLGRKGENSTTIHNGSIQLRADF